MKLNRIFTVSGILVLLLILQSFSFAQPTREREGKSGRNLFEINLLPVSDSLDCYISFNIPYDRLIFIKNGEMFSGGVQIFFDIKLNNKIDQRKSYAKTVMVNSYEETQSREKFIEGLIDVRLANKDYVIQPSLKVENTNQIINLDSLALNFSRTVQNVFFQPIVIEKIKNSCADQGLFRLVNRNNSIPFAPENFDLLIPVNSNTVNEALIKIEQPGQVSFNEKLPVQITENLNLSECEESIIIRTGKSSEKTHYVLVENFNKKLSEGPVTIKIIDGSNENSYNLSVDWINKPITLMNPNTATELLEIIYDRSELLDLYKSSNQLKYKALVDFWNKKFPKREFQFNEWMNEFYQRADYAMKNFSNLANQIGAKTDRGKIYIQYGKPDEIKREYSSSNNIVEIWYYKDLQKEFVFTDRTGLGNYTLGK
ncbi:MAG: GWxTD domain-containing protein [Ignavibacteria bacterium]|nr:GWxTD domain-containing protein [Ignavibacteria bacterium]